MSSTFGTLFRVTTFGESHGKAVGAIVDGCPANLRLSEADIQTQLDRRRPGQSDLSTPRDEKDAVTILSGVEGGLTLGTPIGLLVENRDQRPGDYSETADIPRPSHADFTYQMKYGIRASTGGGRSSARETIGRVSAGAIAEKILKEWHDLSIVAYVSSVGTIDAPEISPATFIEELTREAVDRSPVRCPHKAAAAKMIALIEQTRDRKDSVGGVVTCVCRNVPVGLGEPVFEKLEALCAQREPARNTHQQQWRRAGRHFQRRADCLSRRLQTARHHRIAPANGDVPGQRGLSGSRRPSRSLRRASGGADCGVHDGPGPDGYDTAAKLPI
jgi:chorismate synthase